MPTPIPTRHIREINRRVLEFVEHVGLLIIGLATIFAASQEVWGMVTAGKVALADLLLMFLYLEVLAMVGHYYSSGKLPVRLPLYIGIVALARYLILDMKSMDETRVIAVTAAILILAFAVLTLRFGQARFPYVGEGSVDGAHDD